MDNRITPEFLTAKMMKGVMWAVLALMLAGFVFMLFKINAAPVTPHVVLGELASHLSMPDSTLFFSLSVVLLLSVPILISCITAIFFIIKKKRRMALVSLCLFLVMAISITATAG